MSQAGIEGAKAGDGAGSSRADVPFWALVPFIVLTFALAWGAVGGYLSLPAEIQARLGAISAHHPLFIFAVWAPATSTFLIVLATTGPRGLARYLSRLALWRCPPAWWAYLLFGIPLIYMIGALMKGTLIGAPFPFDSVAAALGAMAFMLVLGPVEEFGWRGLALPLLQRRVAPIWAGLIVGFVWGLWHFPAFLLSGAPQSQWSFMPFFIGSIAVAVTLTPLFNASRGSILLAMLYHFQLNNPLWPDAQPYDTIPFVLAAVVAVWLNRKTMFTRTGATTAVAPPATPAREYPPG